MVGVDAGFGQETAGFAAVEEQIVGPFQAGLKRRGVGDEFAEVKAHPQRERRHAGRFDLRAKGEGDIKVAVGGTVPRATEAAAGFGLATGDDGKRLGPAGGELARGFVVGAIDFVENGE